MNTTKKIFAGLMLLSISLLSDSAFAAPKINDILKQVEDMMEMKSDIKSKVILTQQKAGEDATKRIEMIYYRRDSDDSFLIVMIAPESDKGNGYLRVGDNFWMYRRNTRSFQFINRDENIGGSDAKGDDFENRKLTEMYEAAKNADGSEKISEEMLGNIPVYKVELIAKVKDVDYPKKIYWLRKDQLLPLKEQAFSKNGTLMQTAYYRKYNVINGRYVPVEQLFIDEVEKGNRTIVELSGIATDTLSKDLFTKTTLENLSK